MQATDNLPRTIWPARFLLIVLGLGLLTEISLGESFDGVEVKPFGLLNADTSLSIRYLLDDNDRRSDSSVTSFEDRSTWEQELFVLTKSYVYHPGFLNMDLGGGPLFLQQDFDSNLGSSSTNETLFNFLARFNFLDLKSYPFSLYFRRSHPSVMTSLSGRFITENTDYGFTGRSSGLINRADLELDLEHRSSEGEGFETIVDYELDRGRFKWTQHYRDTDKVSIEHSRIDQDSSSGSAGLPIQDSRIREKRSSITAKNTFGSDGRFVLDQFFLELDQDTETESVSDLEYLNYVYTANGRWQNTESIRSFGDYRFNETRRSDTDTKTHYADLGLNHSLGNSLWYDLLIDYETDEQTGFNRDRWGLGGRLNYTANTPVGDAGLVGSIRYERTDQRSDSATVRVFDEPVTLVGTAPVDLANEFVVTGSVVVRNVSGTQVFVEDVDYRLIVVGSITSVQRLIDGSILDGQTVLVNYEYLTSGTAEFDTVSAGIGASLNFLKFANAQLRYNVRDLSIISGELTTPINDLKRLEFVLGADVPFGRRFQIGGEFRYTDQDEDIAPFVRESLAVNAATRINGALRVHASATLIQVDREASIEDTDQVIYRAGISGRLFGRLQIGYEASYLEDTGGSLFREQLQHRINIQGGYRRVNFILQALVSEDTQGSIERNYTRVTASVTRYF